MSIKVTVCNAEQYKTRITNTIFYHNNHTINIKQKQSGTLTVELCM